jgi:hypothetical protein
VWHAEWSDYISFEPADAVSADFSIIMGDASWCGQKEKVPEVLRNRWPIAHDAIFKVDEYHNYWMTPRRGA